MWSLQFMLWVFVCVCVSSNCKASGRLTWLTEPALLLTTSTDWWPSAVPGMNLCPSISPSACWWKGPWRRGVLCVCLCVRMSVLACWPGWEPDSLCLHRVSFACACAMCQLGLNLSSTFFSPTQPSSHTFHLPTHLPSSNALETLNRTSWFCGGANGTHMHAIHVCFARCSDTKSTFQRIQINTHTRAFAKCFLSLQRLSPCVHDRHHNGIHAALAQTGTLS